LDQNQETESECDNVREHSVGVKGGLLRRETAPIDKASPNIRSVNDSILPFGIRLPVSLVSARIDTR
jgi:hypothetical protein